MALFASSSAFRLFQKSLQTTSFYNINKQIRFSITQARSHEESIGNAADNEGEQELAPSFATLNTTYATQEEYDHDEDVIEYNKLVPNVEKSQRTMAQRRAWRVQSKAIRQFIATPPDTFIPPVMAQAVNDALKDMRYSRKRGDEYAQTASHMWHTANRLPQEYAVVSRVLHELRMRIPVLNLKRVLEYGCSSGAGSWALYEIFGDELRHAQWTCIDSADKMHEAHKMNTAPLQLEHIVYKNRFFESSKSSSKPSANFIRQNLVLSAYTLSRTAEDERKDLIEKLWSVTDDVLVLIENGDQTGSDIIIAAREHLLKKFGKRVSKQSTNEYATIVAPCPHDKECPMLKQASSDSFDGKANLQKGKSVKICRFAQRLVLSSIPSRSSASTLPDMSSGSYIQLFHYLIIHRGQNQLPQVNDEAKLDDDSLYINLSEDTIQQFRSDSVEDDAMMKAADDDDAGTTNSLSNSRNIPALNASTTWNSRPPNLNTSPSSSLPLRQEFKRAPISLQYPASFPTKFFTHRFNRIVSAPLRRPKLVIMDLCNASGELERRIISKSAGLSHGYEQAKFARWGDLWQFPRYASRTDLRKQQMASEGKIFKRMSKSEKKAKRKLKMLEEASSPKEEDPNMMAADAQKLVAEANMYQQRSPPKLRAKTLKKAMQRADTAASVVPGQLPWKTAANAKQQYLGHDKYVLKMEDVSDQNEFDPEKNKRMSRRERRNEQRRRDESLSRPEPIPSIDASTQPFIKTLLQNSTLAPERLAHRSIARVVEDQVAKDDAAITRRALKQFKQRK